MGVTCHDDSDPTHKSKGTDTNTSLQANGHQPVVLSVDSEKCDTQNFLLDGSSFEGSCLHVLLRSGL